MPIHVVARVSQTGASTSTGLGVWVSWLGTEISTVILMFLKWTAFCGQLQIFLGYVSVHSPGEREHKMARNSYVGMDGNNVSSDHRHSFHVRGAHIEPKPL